MIGVIRPWVIVKPFSRKCKPNLNTENSGKTRSRLWIDWLAACDKIERDSNPDEKEQLWIGSFFFIESTQEDNGWAIYGIKQVVSGMNNRADIKSTHPVEHVTKTSREFEVLWVWWIRLSQAGLPQGNSNSLHYRINGLPPLMWTWIIIWMECCSNCLIHISNLMHLWE